MLKNRSAFLDLFKKWKFFSLKYSSKSKWESRKKYANEIVAMENEMKEAKEKIEEMKKEKELLFVSSRQTHIVTPGRLRQDELKAQQMTPTTSKRFGIKIFVAAERPQKILY